MPACCRHPRLYLERHVELHNSASTRDALNRREQMMQTRYVNRRLRVLGVFLMQQIMPISVICCK